MSSKLNKDMKVIKKRKKSIKLQEEGLIDFTPPPPKTEPNQIELQKIESVESKDSLKKEKPKPKPVKAVQKEPDPSSKLVYDLIEQKRQIKLMKGGSKKLKKKRQASLNRDLPNDDIPNCWSVKASSEGSRSDDLPPQIIMKSSDCYIESHSSDPGEKTPDMIALPIGL